MLKVLLATLLVFLLFISCTKENLRTQRTEVLEKMVQRNHDNRTYTFNYSYDDQNRLAYIKVGSSFYTWQSVTEVQYDAQGRLSKALYYDTNDSNVITRQNHSYTFFYDNQNRISRKIYTALSPTTTGGKDHSFGYDSKGRLIADSTLAGPNGEVERYSVFIYDGSNNVTETREFFGGGAAPLYTYFSTYDGKQNPYIHLPGLGAKFYFVNYSTQDLSANNLIINFRSGDEPSVYKHEYAPDGKLVKSVSFPEIHPQWANTFEYFYRR